jgi:hypothetical protein
LLELPPLLALQPLLPLMPLLPLFCCRLLCWDCHAAAALASLDALVLPPLLALPPLMVLQPLLPPLLLLAASNFAIAAPAPLLLCWC